MLDRQGGKEDGTGLRKATPCCPSGPSALSSRLSVESVSSVGDCVVLCGFQPEPAAGGSFSEKSLCLGLLPQGSTWEQQAVCCRQTTLWGHREGMGQERSANVGFYCSKPTEVKPQRE